MICVNDIVMLRGEPEAHIVREVNGDRLMVSPVRWEYGIVPVECVHIDDVTLYPYSDV